MQFEEAELGVKQSGGVHVETSGHNGEGKGANPRHMRESLPPTWASSSLDSKPPKTELPGHDVPGAGNGDEKARRQMGDEREVRKDGHWVHSRR